MVMFCETRLVYHFEDFYFLHCEFICVCEEVTFNLSADTVLHTPKGMVDVRLV
jgi:hypothetical protein